MKTLYLLRHAKSSWKDSTLADRDRPLNKRGLRNAPEMGQRLRRKCVQLDRIISSPALRALTTARLIAAEIGFLPEQIEQNDALYFTSFMAMLEVIRQTPEHINRLMLVGHNPDMTSLLHLLAPCDIEDMPTCAIATLQFEVDWLDLKPKQTTLVDYDYSKKT